MPRKKQEPVDRETAQKIGGVLRDLRKTSGFRAVHDAATTPGCPAAQQTIYAYERGGLVPSLRQFMELVEFYALREGEPNPAVRHQAVAAMVVALATPAYHLTEAFLLIERLQVPPRPGRRRSVRADGSSPARKSTAKSSAKKTAGRKTAGGAGAKSRAGARKS